MTTATKTRHLHAVTDHDTARAAQAVPNSAENTEVLKRREAAHAALEAPDVELDVMDAIARIAKALDEEDANQAALLADLARRMFTLGYLDGAGDRAAAGRRLKAEQGLPAKIIKVEDHERKELPAKERELRVVRP